MKSISSRYWVRRKYSWGSRRGQALLGIIMISSHGISAVIFSLSAHVKDISASQIELILDASGSMRGKTADGKLKIDIAKNVLRSIIQNLPEGLEVTLRVYS